MRIQNNSLIFTDTEGQHMLSVLFMRTLRIPDNGKTYPLPPGLGTYPVRRVQDYPDTVPPEWLTHGGVFLPMYPREAMWLAFSGGPAALKVGVGKVCAISGEPWADQLRDEPQDYVVPGVQPWLDGIASGKGTIRQFVAMPLGLGATVEGQVTGEEKHGGIQLQAFAAKPGAIPKPRRMVDCMDEDMDIVCASMALPSPAPVSSCSTGAFPRKKRAGAMGLAAGGRMKQKIYPDPHGMQVWDPSSKQRVFVHLVNSMMWEEITGEPAPKTPVSAKTYAKHGLPWFDLYDETAPTLDPTDTLAGVKSLAELDAEKSTHPLQDDDDVAIGVVKKIKSWFDGEEVVDGTW